MIKNQMKKINNEMKNLKLRTKYTDKEMNKNSLGMRKYSGDEFTELYTTNINMLHSNRLKGDFNAIIMKKTSYTKILTEIRECMMNIIVNIDDIGEKDKMIIFDIIINGINEKIKKTKPKIEYVLNGTIRDLQVDIRQSKIDNGLKEYIEDMLDYAMNSTIRKKLNTQTNKQVRLLNKAQAEYKRQEKKKEKSIEDIARQERYKMIENFAKETIGDDYHKYVQISMS